MGSTSDAGPATAGELKPWDRNPRTASAEWGETFGQAMDLYGDLSGIVFNLTSGHLVGGHRRGERLPASAKIERVHEQPRDRQGTVALGFVVMEQTGERWAYREVEWDTETEIAANLAANKWAADWDPAGVRSMLAQLEKAGADVALTGFTSDDTSWLAEVEEQGAAVEDTGEPRKLEVPRGELTTVWVLVGVPIALYGLVAEKVQALAKIDGVYVESTTNDTKP